MVNSDGGTNYYEIHGRNFRVRRRLFNTRFYCIISVILLLITSFSFFFIPAIEAGIIRGGGSFPTRGQSMNDGDAEIKSDSNGEGSGGETNIPDSSPDIGTPDEPSDDPNTDPGDGNDHEGDNSLGDGHSGGNSDAGDDGNNGQTPPSTNGNENDGNPPITPPSSPPTGPTDGNNQGGSSVSQGEAASSSVSQSSSSSGLSLGIPSGSSNNNGVSQSEPQQNQEGNIIIRIINQEEITGITGVNFQPSPRLRNVTIRVTLLEKKPDDVSIIPIENSTTRAFLDIKVFENASYVEEQDIEFLSFDFRLEKLWLEKYNIDKETVTLLRYHSGEWQILHTIFTYEDENYTYYEAETPGCSTFAIIGTEVIEVQPYPSQHQGIPWTAIVGFSILASITLLVILFKAGYIYYDQDQYQKEKKLNKKFCKNILNPSRFQIKYLFVKASKNNVMRYKTRCLFSTLFVHLARFSVLISSSISIIAVVALIS
jgi:PGF-pre-PGF domain-containing protein